MIELSEQPGEAEPTTNTGHEADSLSEVENSATRCQHCIDCDDHRDDVSAGAPSWEQIPELQSPRELVEFPGISKTGERHIADPDGILAHYSFDDEVECSLKGDHRHKQGLVVRTLCGMVLCMGRQCGKNSIVGFDGILHTSSKRKRFQADLRVLEKWIPAAKVRLDAISRRVQKCTDAADTVRKSLPALCSELSSRRNRGDKGLEVHLPKRMNSQDLPAELRGASAPTLRLRGLCIFDSNSIALTRLRSTLVRFVELDAESPPIDGPSAEALRKVAALFDDRAQRLDEWLQEASHFPTEENLHVALVALGRDSAQITREAGGWRVSYMPGETALLPTDIS